jgi:hypothetical protein
MLYCKLKVLPFRLGFLVLFDFIFGQHGSGALELQAHLRQYLWPDKQRCKRSPHQPGQPREREGSQEQHNSGNVAYGIQHNHRYLDRSAPILDLTETGYWRTPKPATSSLDACHVPRKLAAYSRVLKMPPYTGMQKSG